MPVTIDAPAALTTRWRRAWPIAAALLSLLVLGGSVQSTFTEVRIKLLPTPAPEQASVSVALPPASAIPDPFVVFVYRLRNPGETTVSISAALGERTLGRVDLEPGAEQRVDVSAPRSAIPASGEVEFSGTGGRWALDYLEVANLHGFTRGAVEFLVLPAGQSFTRPSAWVFGLWALCVLLMTRTRAASLPAWGRLTHGVVAGIVVLLFTVVAIAPVLSGYRVALAQHTFAGSMLVLAAPQVLRLSGLATRLRIPPLPWLRIGLAGGLAVFVLVLVTWMGAYAGGADQSGYLNSARLLSDGRISTPMRVVAGAPEGTPAVAYMPLGFRINGSDMLVPTYPLGLPLLVAALAPFVGWGVAPHLTMVLHAIGGVVLMFLMGREWGLSSRLSALGALVLATSPLYLFMSLSLMSDVPALVWTGAAVFLAWRSRRDPRWALACGVAVAVAVLIRPTNILVIAPIALCLGWSRARWAWLVAGGVPGAVLLISYNLAAYDAAVTTGYGDYSYLFTLDNVPRSLTNYVTWLPVLLTPLGVLGLGLPKMWRQDPLVVTMLLVWSSAFLVFYALYYFTFETWWYLRFVLPAFPPLIVAGLWVGRAIAARLFPSANAAAVALLAIALLAHNARWSDSLGALSSGSGERAYFQAAEWSRSNLPADAAIIGMQVSGSFFYYTNFPIVRWDMLSGDEWTHLRAAIAERRQPLYAVLFPYEVDDMKALVDHVPGNWVRVTAIEHITVWQLMGGTAEGQ